MTESELLIDGTTPLGEDDLGDLASAVAVLERPSLVARASDLIGKPIDVVLDSLPSGASQRISSAVRTSLNAALDLALKTMRKGRRPPPAKWRHKLQTIENMKG